MKNNIRSHKNLLAEMVRTDFKLRYQGSVLGYAWSLLRPLLMFAILYTVFTQVFKVGNDVPNFPIYLLLGVVFWGFFTEMTQQGLGSIVARGDLIRKISIPRWMIIVSASIGALINLALNLVVMIVLSIISGVDFLTTSIYVPFFILLVYLLALGVSLILSALYVKYRDISYIWDVILQAGFYATPILYPVTLSTNLITNDLILKILFLNPLATAIQGARNAYVTGDTITISEAWGSRYAILMPIGITAVIVVIGVLYFKSQSKNFAENL